MSATILASLLFHLLSPNDHVTLRVEMTLHISHPSKAQVFWTGQAGAFSGERGASFDVRPGKGIYDVTVPADLGRLRIDPLSEPGLVEVRSIDLTRWGIALHAWGGRRGFEGWSPLADVAGMEVRGGTLQLRATGSDPGLASAPLDLIWGCHLMDALLSLLLGLGSGLILAAAVPAARPWRLDSWLEIRALFSGASRFLGRSIAILVLGAGLAEGALRIYHHFNPVFIFPSEGTNRFRGQPFAPDYGSGFHLNSHGFKDVEFESRKRPGTVRILGLGDSFAFGVVPYEHNYLTLLEQDLHRASPPAEVINMGIPSIGPGGYVEVLVNEGLPLHADMVIVSFFIGNDLMEALGSPPRPRSFLVAFLRYLVGPKPQGVPIHSNVPYHDDLPSFEPAKYLEIEHERAAIFRKDHGSFGTALAAARAHLERMKRICDAQKLELLVVLIPDEIQVNPELEAEVATSFPGAAGDIDYDLPNRRLGLELQGLGIRYLDLLGPFRETGRTKRLYKPRDSHWNIAGNRLAADLIREELLRGDTKFWPRPGK